MSFRAAPRASALRAAQSLGQPARRSAGGRPGPCVLGWLLWAEAGAGSLLKVSEGRASSCLLAAAWWWWAGWPFPSRSCPSLSLTVPGAWLRDLDPWTPRSGAQALGVRGEVLAPPEPKPAGWLAPRVIEGQVTAGCVALSRG